MLGKYPPTKSFNDRRVVRKSDYFSDEFSQYLCFKVTFGSNNLTSHRELSPEQQQTHDLIKSLHDDGMGYRKIAKHLNERGIKTIRGNEWKNTLVSSVLKRNKERLKRLKVRKQEPKIEYGKMELVWLRN